MSSHLLLIYHPFIRIPTATIPFIRIPTATSGSSSGASSSDDRTALVPHNSDPSPNSGPPLPTPAGVAAAAVTGRGTPARQSAGAVGVAGASGVLGVVTSVFGSGGRGRRGARGREGGGGPGGDLDEDEDDDDDGEEGAFEAFKL